MLQRPAARAHCSLATALARRPLSTARPGLRPELAWSRRRSSSTASSASSLSAPLDLGSNLRTATPEHNNYLGKILNARVYEAARETPLQHAPTLSLSTGNRVLIKREDLQPVFSFKIRGAYNKISQLSEAQREKGIVACSAGNHAQGVAMSASLLGIDAVIVMPRATPAIKVDAVRKMRGNVRLHGDTYDEAQTEAMRLVAEEGRTLIHPFDDPLVIAGQGTIGMEVLKQSTGKPLHAIFVCCGGGGMLAGVAAYVKRVRPGVKVIGVEAEDAAGMTASLRQGALTTLPSVGIFADGAAVKTVGQETFRICNELVDDMVTVSTDEICAAIKDGFMDTRCVLEPAGALAIAGVKRWAAQTGTTGQTLVVTASGANMDFDRLRFVSERADASETLLSVRIPERAGSFRALMRSIEPRNVTEFAYRHGDPEVASIYVSFQARGGDDAAAVLDAIQAEGCDASDLTRNELAKAHARHLVGGRSAIANEQLFRFEFPERPGALTTFLDALDDGWNVTLFHYRNHGHDIGRVLVGLQVPPDEQKRLDAFLRDLDYAHHVESSNPCFADFLR